jgi:ubiquinone/menaquinone biosynthesis C-methylase UbiE
VVVKVIRYGIDAACSRGASAGILCVAGASKEADMPEAHLFTSMTFPEIYERVLVQPLFRPFADELVARLKPQAGDSLIDIACGTGIVARIGRERLGPTARIVGVDQAPGMLGVARSVDPTIEWREGRASALPVGEGETFSLLTCHQGLQFFPEKAAATREMRRVLAAGGRVAIGCWRSLQDTPTVLELNQVAERHVGPIRDSRHSFGNPEELRTLLADNGFDNVAVDTFTHDVRFADGNLFANLNAMAVIGMTETGKTLSETERGELARQIVAESREVISRYMQNGELVVPLSSNIATATA